MIPTINGKKLKIGHPQTLGNTFPWFSGPYNVPKSSEYTWYNQGTVTLADRVDRLILTHSDDGATDSIHVLAKAIPLTPPYTITMIAGAIWSIAWNGSAGTGNTVGIVLGSSSNSWRTFAFNRKWGNSGYIVNSWTSATSMLANVYDGRSRWQKANEAFLCFKITDDGTNRRYYSSVNGLSWWLQYIESTNTYVTPTQLGFAIRAVNGGFSSGYWSGGDASQLITNKIDIMHFDIKPGIYGDEP